MMTGVASNRTPTAFIAAGVALLALPLLIAVGILIVGLIAGMPGTDPTVNPRVVTGFIVWVTLVLIAVAVFLIWLLRKPRIH